MTTAETIGHITDTGMFEKIVIQILRKKNREYDHILHTGVNAEGKPMRSPLDGFGRDPAISPPQLLMVQATTTDQAHLREKWLADRPSLGGGTEPAEGDLIKAGREARRIGGRLSDPRFTVVLATNRTLSPQLAEDVIAKAEELNINCEILDQSRIVDFLDNDPLGQWLRKEYLGIDTQLLSKPVLRELCDENVNSYARGVLSEPSLWVSREVEELMQERLQASSLSAHMLLGPSGMGKSVVAFRTLKKHLESGGFGIWAPAELVEKCVDVSSLINSVFRGLRPNLDPMAGQSVPRFLTEGKSFLIVVDDLDGTQDPAKVLRRVLSWSRTTSSRLREGGSKRLPCTLIVPVRPHHLSSDLSLLLVETLASIIQVGVMTGEEGTEAIRIAGSELGIGITEPEARDLALRMGNDPLLIGLFNSLLPGVETTDLQNLAADTLKKFVDHSLGKLAAADESRYTASDYRDSLLRLSSEMLKRRRMAPHWNEIRDWLRQTPDMLPSLRQVLRYGDLCRLIDEERLVFRHERIRDYFLTQTLALMLQKDLAENQDVFEEPYYAELIGRALLVHHQDQDIIERIGDRLPLAVFEALRHLGTATDDYLRAIVRKAEEWLRDEATRAPESVLSSVCWSLVGTDSPHLLGITEAAPENQLILLARFRNGCAVSGAKYYGRQPGLSPAIHDSLRDAMASHAATRHREKLLADLKELLKSTSITEEDRKGALALAGSLGIGELGDAIVSCWHRAEEPIDLLPETIWAALRCYGPATEGLLSSLFANWSRLPHEDSSGISPRMAITEEIRLALSRGIPEEAVSFLVEQSNQWPELDWPITVILANIDSPVAVESTVRKAAEIERNRAGTDQVSPWVVSLPDAWDPRLRGRKLSQSSLARLETLWRDPQNGRFVREQSFRLWTTGIGPERLDALKQIGRDSDLFQHAIRERVRLGDYGAVSDLTELLSDSDYWFRYAHNVWCKKLFVATQQRLGALEEIPVDYSGGRCNHHYDLSRLLLTIPGEDAEQLLKEHWVNLQYSPLFIQTALYVGTEETLRLAASAIDKCPAPVSLFEHIGFTYGFYDIEREKRLDVSKLNALVPYLDYLAEEELRNLTEECMRLGYHEWARDHLQDRLTEVYKTQYFPSDEDLAQELSQIACDPRGEILARYWLKERSHEPKNRILAVIRRWLQSNLTLSAFRIAAACIETIGDREDLSILDDCDIEDQPEQVTKRKVSTQFAVYRRTLG